MLTAADSIPPEFWGVVGAIVAALGTVIAILGRQLEGATKALESLQNKMIDQAVPALERSTLAGQAMVPLLQQNAEAIGSITKATEDSVRATTEVMQWLAILKDRDDRPSHRGGTA